MKLIRTSFGIFSLLVVLTNITNAQDNQAMADEQKAWIEYMTPGWAHQLLAEHAGEWNTITTMWMDPSASPQKMVGISKIEMVMGGRYLKSTHSGVMMEMPFEGMSIEGFDNVKKEFTSVWIDNFGTGISVSTGKYDEKSKSITYTGVVYDPIQGLDVNIKQVVNYLDNDHHSIEMYSLMNGQEIKNMEVVFERKK